MARQLLSGLRLRCPEPPLFILFLAQPAVELDIFAPTGDLGVSAPGRRGGGNSAARQVPVRAHGCRLERGRPTLAATDLTRPDLSPSPGRRRGPVERALPPLPAWPGPV